MTRAAGIRLAALLAAATLCCGAAGAAAQAPIWQDAGASTAADAELAAIAAAPAPDGDAVVAVGQQAGRAIAYRLAAGRWAAVALPASEGSSGAVDVALDGAGDAWVVGWQQPDQDGASRRALVVRFHAGEWTEVATPADQPALTAVAVAGRSVLAGDAAGAVHSLSAAGIGPALSEAAPGSLTAVSSLAAAGGQLAIGGGATGAGTGLVDVDAADGSVRRAAAIPATDGAQVVAVAARPGEQLALDGERPCGAGGAPGTAVPGLWSRADATAPWQRGAGPSVPGGSRLCDLAVLPDGPAFVVGGVDGRAAIWQRGAGGWQRTDRAGSGELRGVAALAADDVWAVGSGGALLHLAPPPPPSPPPPPPPPPASPGGHPAADQPASAPPPPPEGAPPPAADAPARTEGSSEPAPASSPAQAPRVPAAIGEATRPRRAGRLLARLSVRRGTGRRLVVRFRLRAPSKVVVRALLGRRVVGRTSRAAMGRGSHVLLVRYRGRRPPTRLQIAVRRLGAGGA